MLVSPAVSKGDSEFVTVSIPPDPQPNAIEVRERDRLILEFLRSHPAEPSAVRYQLPFPFDHATGGLQLGLGGTPHDCVVEVCPFLRPFDLVPPEVIDVLVFDLRFGHHRALGSLHNICDPLVVDSFRRHPVHWAERSIFLFAIDRAQRHNELANTIQEFFGGFQKGLELCNISLSKDEASRSQSRDVLELLLGLLNIAAEPDDIFASGQEIGNDPASRLPRRPEHSDGIGDRRSGGGSKAAKWPRGFPPTGAVLLLLLLAGQEPNTS
mmetsp:Transcript_27273/g.66340  ORF Transcript_27273/g.66340 Transcript_27273/m.66340 type:complete len:268 (+) Transcript_27273:45-848(+)